MEKDPAQEEEDRMLVHMNPIRNAEKAGDSEIQKVFEGAVIFITGGSGFVGKQLLEKLFRSCRGIKKVYLLSRNKKGRSMEERLKHQMKNPIYDEAKKVNPGFESKITLIEGDITELKLGINDKDWKILTQEVTMIFHVAATVRFDEPLKKSIITNVRGTREAIQLGKECIKLRSFVYVSTAFAHCNRSTVKEEFYPSPVDPNTIIDFVEKVEENRLISITNELISGWPNTYTYSKAIAEDLVKTNTTNLPICIVRPPIVMPTYHEPLVGWLDKSNVYGPSGIVFGTGIGIIRVLYISQEFNPDVMPLDYVNNIIITSAWDNIKRYEKGDKSPKVFTLSRCRNPMNWQFAHNYISSEARCLVSPKTIWYCYCIMVRNKILYSILSFFLHYVPAFFLDIVLMLMGYDIRLKRVYNSTHKVNMLLSYFLFNSWLFHDDNVIKLTNKMSEKDRIIFNFQCETIDQVTETTAWIVGLRKYIVKDGLTGTREAVKRQLYFKILNYLILSLYLWIFWKLLSYMYWLYVAMI